MSRLNSYNQGLITLLEADGKAIVFWLKLLLKNEKSSVIKAKSIKEQEKRLAVFTPKSKNIKP